MMPFRTTMPHRLISPRKAVNPNGLWVTISPKTAPNSISGIDDMTTSGSDIRLELHQQDQEDGHEADRERPEHLRKGLVLVELVSPPYSIR